MKYKFLIENDDGETCIYETGYTIDKSKSQLNPYRDFEYGTICVESSEEELLNTLRILDIKLKNRLEQFFKQNV